jgi:hypothetical protein
MKYMFNDRDPELTEGGMFELLELKSHHPSQLMLIHHSRKQAN